jgi:16S rRNA A1518/A1519 N6-dimethyltransferase RsmA/KsgA/DIM1 with predicted DNA glycosylase/AP lyase activity
MNSFKDFCIQLFQQRHKTISEQTKTKTKQPYFNLIHDVQLNQARA